jgi:hypothetical protein
MAAPRGVHRLRAAEIAPGLVGARVHDLDFSVSRRYGNGGSRIWSRW